MYRLAYHDTRLSAGDVLDALNSSQRRELLRSLIDESPQTGTEVTAPDAGGHLRMRHCHLPKLAQYSLIVTDEERNEIAVGPNIDDVQPMLEHLAAFDS